MAAILRHATFRRRDNWGVILSLSLSLTLATAHQAACAADTTPDLETVRAAVDFYGQSVKSLEGRFVQNVRREAGATYPLPASFPGDLRIEVTFQADLLRGAAFTDALRSYWLPGRNGKHVPFEIHDVRAFDGTHTYNLIHSHVKSPVETKVPLDDPLQLIIDADNVIGNQYVPWDFAGLRLFGKGRQGLAALLRDPSVKVDGQEDANGACCVRVVQVYDKDRPFAVWLDPTHDYLPRRIEMTQATPDGGSKLLHRFDVFEFRKFPDAARGKEKWFPVRGQVGNWLQEVTEFEVLDLKINPTIDPGRFAIREEDLPDGVKVVRDHGRSESYTGGRKDIWDERKRLYDEEDVRIAALIDTQVPRPADKTFPAVAAEVIGGIHWSSWLLGVFSIVLIIAGGISITRARRR